MTAFLRGLPPEAYQRVGAHSADGTRSLDQQLQIYSWHGRHHVAHVTALRSRMGW
jgi:hypothetical protein